MASLVTGATGFVGREVLHALLADGETVVATSHGARDLDRRPGLTWVQADLGRFQRWGELLDGVDTVYHFAWSTLPKTANADPVTDASTNIVGTLRLLEALKTRPGTRFVFASSGGTVYGPLRTVPAQEDHPTRPITAYGVAKLAVEAYLTFWADMWGLDPVSLRIANPFGPGQRSDRQFGAVATFAASVLARRPITIFGDGAAVRDYLYISDLVRAVLAAGRTRSTSRVLNIGTGEGRSLNDIIAALSGELGTAVEVRYEPSRAFDVPVSILDIARANRELGWAPEVSFAEGVGRTLRALRQRTDAKA